MASLTTIIEQVLGISPALRQIAGFRRLTVSSVIRRMTGEMLRSTSANELLRVLKSQGLGVRREWLLRQVRYERQSLQILEQKLATDLDEITRTEDMPEAPVALSHEYSYQLEMEVRGYTATSPTSARDIDEWGTQQYWFGSDDLMTPRQVLSAFEARFRQTTMAEVDATWESLRYIRATKRGPDI